MASLDVILHFIDLMMQCIQLGKYTSIIYVLAGDLNLVVQLSSIPVRKISKVNIQ